MPTTSHWLAAFGIWTCMVFAGFCSPAVVAEHEPNIELQNGTWFNGTNFESGTRYIVGDSLVSTKPDSISERIDLEGGYVIPPFSDAHTHRPATTDRILSDSQFFLDAGIFYIMNHGNISRYSESFRSALASAGTVDAVFSNGIVSSPQSHSVELWQRLHARGAFPDIEEHELDGEAYFVIETAADLLEKWPQIEATRPDFVKIMLQFSEEYEQRRIDPHYFGLSGVDPSLVDDIVDRAHAVGLRVAAHIETAEDFRLAVAAGVDIIAHLPGYDIGINDDVNRYRLIEDDAVAAAENDVVVLTTTLLSEDRSEGHEAKYSRMMQNHRENLRLLSQAGVRLGIGSDQFSKHAVDELMHLDTLGLYDNATLLRMICVVTPKAIFPDRRIGQLVDGAEASFLVLENNPLDDIAAVREIRLRVKSGAILGSE
ncbi:MAG: amidohydrolase family protein [Gammaproteobacteria bacterium]|nr:amidohydrolase family protein [Gammaproteobacteria bacterium]NNF49539.1 amidohydrolase family protein [Woeseiaceae bacterium]MBT8093833.1 amidohydrolase family protein [Gammaproteobacteria bacterium]MBT8105824.1 amidohydrolase family protein [Gammaproteobacteria bacterium]NNK25838.1 amidohydrolase family protein [Woeseiaceae bacterium]